GATGRPSSWRARWGSAIIGSASAASLRGAPGAHACALGCNVTPAPPTMAPPAALAARAQGQQQPAQGEGRGGRGGRGGFQGELDDARARQLYVSTDPKDHSKPNYAAQIEAKKRTDGRFEQACKGIIDYKKTTYRSSVGDLDIPAYVFQPLKKRGPKGHAALVWVHGGVHGDQSADMFPFIREAVDRGYVVIAPDYRGSTGYGETYYQAIDYGGYEVDDVMS